tara:strand:- start:87 stop:548 length:462 start_codon:yes stop_codon:yes gene_type:complete
MAEIQVQGVKIGGSKMLLIVPLLGTIIGGLWGGFELYNRYLMMEKKIDTYVAPDLSGFDKQLAIIKEELESINMEVTVLNDINKELKNDLRTDVRRIEKIVNDVEQRVKQDSRNNSQDMKDFENNLMEKLKEKEEAINDKIDKALNNPLMKNK